VDIIGICKTTNENCIDIVEEIGKCTNTELNVIEAYRIDFFGIKAKYYISEIINTGYAQRSNSQCKSSCII